MADKQERTEEASPRKKEEARSEGQVARSPEVSIALGMIAALMALRISSGGMFTWLERVTQRNLRMVGDNAHTELTVRHIQSLTLEGVNFLLMILSPLFIALVVTGLTSNLVQVGPFFSLKPLKPKFNRISLGKGFGALFSKRSIVEAIKSVVKIILLSCLAYNLIAGELPRLMMLPSAGWEAVLPVMMMLVYRLAFWMAIIFVLLAALDYTYQRWQYNQNLKMSKEEIKEETKQYEGDPQVKARIRSVQRDVARRRMMNEIPTASVVITNPHELAIALQYDREAMGAPKVVAKGARLIAARIREIARENNVPIVEDKPLARALYKSVPIGREIPGDYYKAVAEVLAYVYRLKRSYAPRPYVPAATPMQAAVGGGQ